MEDRYNENETALDKEGLSGYEELNYIDPEKSSFKMTSGGFLSLHIEPDKDYPRVNLVRMFPFSNENDYISVRDEENNEIGIIKSLYDYPEETVNIAMIELNRRYFAPVIEKVSSIKEEFGYFYWDVMTNSGPKRFTVQGEQHTMTNITENRVLVTDVDGNRFEIPDYKALDAKYYKIIEALL